MNSYDPNTHPGAHLVSNAPASPGPVAGPAAVPGTGTAHAAFRSR